MPAPPSSLALENVANASQLISSPVRNNFSAIQTAMNALVAVLDGGAEGQYLKKLAGSDVDWANGPVVYDRNVADVVCGNTTVQTTMYTKTITGGHMGTDRMLRLRMSGFGTKNAAGNLTIRLYVAGVNWIGRAFALTNNATANNFRWQVEITVMNQGSASAQWVEWRVTFGLNDTLGAVVHDFATVAPTENTAVDGALSVTFQWDTAHADLTMTKSSAILELL